MSAQDHGGRTALHLAVERGNQKMIKLLIDQGAETPPVDRLGCRIGIVTWNCSESSAQMAGSKPGQSGWKFLHRSSQTLGT